METIVARSGCMIVSRIKDGLTARCCLLRRPVLPVSEAGSHELERKLSWNGARPFEVRAATFDFRRGGILGVRRTSSNKVGYARSNIG
jgi:hypothetical protein